MFGSCFSAPSQVEKQSSDLFTLISLSNFSFGASFGGLIFVMGVQKQSSLVSLNFKKKDFRIC